MMQGKEISPPTGGCPGDSLPLLEWRSSYERTIVNLCDPATIEYGLFFL